MEVKIYLEYYLEAQEKKREIWHHFLSNQPGRLRDRLGRFGCCCSALQDRQAGWWPPPCPCWLLPALLCLFPVLLLACSASYCLDKQAVDRSSHLIALPGVWGFRDLAGVSCVSHSQRGFSGDVSCVSRSSLETQGLGVDIP